MSIENAILLYEISPTENSWTYIKSFITVVFVI